MEKKYTPNYRLSSDLSGKVTWRSPSNIAIVKYWGNRFCQIPRNTSISFTLSKCHTTTTLTYERRQKFDNSHEFSLVLNEKKNDEFNAKIESFFNKIEVYLPFLKDYVFRFETENSFPHSSGIASSASGFSALALCLMSLERRMNSDLTEAGFYEKASFLARLGSGSACRSLDGGIVVWGRHSKIEKSTNLYGIPYEDKVAEVFKKYRDSILLIDREQKALSSSLGHKLMDGHLFSKQRFSRANENIELIKDIFSNGDLDGFIRLVESEALMLHAMMMCSQPYFILMKPNTLKVIEEVWSYRNETGSKLCFTLDAGANVHLLYPEIEMESVQNFIEKELIKYCKGRWIHDFIGKGPEQIDNL